MRLHLSLILATIVAKLPRRKVDPLLTAPSLARETWRDLFPLTWAPFYTDTATAAGDRAVFEVLARQQERDRRFPNRPRHAAWLDDVTGEFEAIVSTSYGEAVAA